ncbi:MAG: hypothetical protein Q9M39_02795 [Sulfurovum sp.]|nr:hypothetical protein [Sulfurovum sp.]
MIYKLFAFYGIENAQEQVYMLHFLLIAIEIIIILLIIKSFGRIRE